MAAGLAYMHSVNIIHGDIKCKNILLGYDLQPLFCDFGISKLREKDSASSSVNKGSITYMSPERLRGDPRSCASDMYAFGITIFEVSHRLAPLNATQLIITWNDRFFRLSRHSRPAKESLP